MLAAPMGAMRGCRPARHARRGPAMLPATPPRPSRPFKTSSRLHVQQHYMAKSCSCSHTTPLPRLDALADGLDGERQRGGAQGPPGGGIVEVVLGHHAAGKENGSRAAGQLAHIGGAVPLGVGLSVRMAAAHVCRPAHSPFIHCT